MTEKDGVWQTSWRVRTDTPIEIIEAWLPHDHFYSPRRRFDPPLADSELHAEVSCEDGPGAVIENAFLILRTPDRRYFARLTIVVNVDGIPQQQCEAVTVQEI